MNKGIFSVIFGCLAAGAFLFLLGSSVRQTAPAEETTLSTVSTQTVLYWVRSRENQIGVYRPGAAEPEFWLETRASSLPDYDRKLLEEGIPIYQEAELTSLLEDLDG